MFAKVISRILLVLALLQTGYFLLAQSGPVNSPAAYIINKRLLSVEDGLASHEVFCGLQDQSGFLWFGTRNGLNRYDGKNCLLFTRQRNKLQDNKVVQIAKDDVNHLFVEYGSTGFQLATNGKIDVINTVTREIKTLTAAFPEMPFKEQDVYWISNDGTNNINLLTANPFRLWKYNSAKGFTLRFEMKDWNGLDTTPLTNHLSAGPFCMFGKGKALLKFTNQATQYVVTDEKVISFKQQNVLRSLPVGFMEDGNLLITYNTESDMNKFAVCAVESDGKINTALDLSKYHLENVKGKYWYQFAGAANSSTGIFYIGSDALYLWNESAFFKVVSKPDIKAFENLFLYQLFPDNLGNLWLCTSTGVLQLKIEKNRFDHYFTARQQASQPNSQARGIYADKTGQVVANIWTHIFREKDSSLQYASDDEIKYALVRHHSGIYCGGYHLFHYDEQQNKLMKFDGGQGTEIWSMFSVNDSILLLGQTNGFSVFNSNTRQFDSLYSFDEHTPAAKFVYRFLKDAHGTLWAVAENGLYKISMVNGRWSFLKEQSPVTEGLSLLDAYFQQDGTCWLATNGEGLYRWDRKSNAFQQFNITSGFPSDVLYRIEPDAYNNLWISSDYGLIRFNTKNFSVTTYTSAKGISHNEFNRTSSFRDSSGRLYFGGLDGVNAFHPKDFITDTTTFRVPLRVVSFNQFVGSKKGLVNKTTDLLNTSQITLAPNDEFFILEFQLLDFSKDEAHRYAYLIEGVDKTWNYINENSLRISGLPYGDYNMRVKAQNRQGAWSKSELSFRVHVLKPFYLRWWFIALAVTLLLIIVYQVMRFRTRQLASDKSKLEQTVSKRTLQLHQSLSAQAALLAEKDVLMKEIHHRVKNNLQVISGLLELQGKGLDDEVAKDALRDGRNRVRSIALIHQNLYQFENLDAIEVSRFVKDLCREVESVFKNQNKVTVDIQVPSFSLDIDTAVPLGLIMNELLSNSFKYAFNDRSAGLIKLEILVPEEGCYKLVYTDDGPGLPADFNLLKATTLGIQLINDLSRQIGGNVKYEGSNGAMFTVNFINRARRKKED